MMLVVMLGQVVMMLVVMLGQVVMMLVEMMLGQDLWL